MTPEQTAALDARKAEHLAWRRAHAAFARVLERRVDVRATTALLDERDPEWDRKLAPSFRAP